MLFSIMLVLSSVPVFASAAISTDGYLTYEIVDEVGDSLYAYVTTETGDDGVEYTVYSADATDSVVKFYFDEDGIASVIKYSTAGFVRKKFMFDEFYTDISDSDFDTSVYDSTSSLTMLFGISILGL